MGEFIWRFCHRISTVFYLITVRPRRTQVTQLKRYTELPFVLQILEFRQLTLLNPSSWDDKNDSHFVQAFREQKGYGSVLALCLTGAAQTYHHWKVFTHGSSGACVCFNREKFLNWIEEDELIIGRKVEYKTLAQVRKSPPPIDDLPFVKRKAYEHEAEYRLLYTTRRKSVPAKSFKMPLDIIDSILLNPWLPPSTASAVEEVIHRIKGCEGLDVLRATIVKNDEWQYVANARTLTSGPSRQATAR